MNTTISVAEITDRTKTQQLSWEQSHITPYSFYCTYNSNDYHLYYDLNYMAKLCVYYGDGVDDYYVVVDPFDSAPIARLYFIVNMLNNLKSN